MLHPPYAEKRGHLFTCVCRWQSSVHVRPVPTKSCGRCSPTGVPIADGEIVKLPEPTLADGMTAAAQRRQIEAIAEGRNSWEDLTRRSVVAPFLLKNLAGRFRAGQGNWDAASTCGSSPTEAWTPWLATSFSAPIQSGCRGFRKCFVGPAAGRCGPEETRLACPVGGRGSAIRGGRGDSAGASPVSATTRSIKTRTAESLLVASVLEPRFAADAEYPNRWRSISRDDAGNRQLGEPHTYQRVGLLRQGHTPRGTEGGDLDRISRCLRGTQRVVQRRKPVAIQAADPRPNRRTQGTAEPCDSLRVFRWAIATRSRWVETVTEPALPTLFIHPDVRHA